MNKCTILVLGVGGNVSQGIVKAIRASKLDCKIIGACVSVDSIGYYECDSAYLSPMANDPLFIAWLVKLCNEKKVDIVLSGVEEILYNLAKHHLVLSDLCNAVFPVPKISTLEIGQSKFNTSSWLKESSCNFPKTAMLNDTIAIEKLINNCGFPLIAKPDRGKGSFGVVVVKSRSELSAIIEPDYCIQEYLGCEEQEYTVGCYYSKKREAEKIIILKRQLKHGTTFKAEIVEDDIISNQCIKIVNRLQAPGPLNIQLRMHNGKPICFELNIRFSGTVAIRANFGYNDVEALIMEYLYGKKPSNYLNAMKDGLAMRYYNEYYMDLGKKKRLEEHGFIENIQETLGN